MSLSRKSILQIGIAVVAALGILWLVIGFGSKASGSNAHSSPTAAASGQPAATHESAKPAAARLRAGERFETVGLAGAYTPSAPSGGTDDYRCFLLDPKLTSDALLTGTTVLPDNLDVTHHAILYRVAPEQVAQAQALDARSDGDGWTCFGDSLIPQPEGGRLVGLNDAPWMAAWAPGSKESVYPAGSGVVLPAGTQFVLQMHYNTRGTVGPDASKVQLRLSDDVAGATSVHTMLLPGPVELPCAPGESGPLCNRGAAVADVTQRFGAGAGQTVAGLQLLCGGSLTDPKSGATQSCDRRIEQPTQIWAAAGHMHLLGKSISIDVNPGTDRERRVLEVPVYDFDNQGARPLAKPVTLQPGDTVRVTCTHDASLRQKLPALQGTEPRYVVLGEGTTDEMCLGILIYTNPKA